MFLLRRMITDAKNRFLRVSGGVSHYNAVQTSNLQFSPRERRCFFYGSFLPRYLPVFSA